MKHLFTLIILTICQNALFGQQVPQTYAADFKIVFDAAKKYYKTDKEGAGKTITDNTFILEYTSKSHFQNAKISRLVADKDEVLNHQAIFEGAKTKTEAEKILRAFIDATKPLMPANFKENKSVNMRYADQSGYSLEFNSEIFAEVAKKPTVTFGIIENNGSFDIEIIIMAPVFTF